MLNLESISMADCFALLLLTIKKKDIDMYIERTFFSDWLKHAHYSILHLPHAYADETIQ